MPTANLYDAPPPKIDWGPKRLRKLLTSIVDYITRNRFTQIDVRERIDPDEPLRAIVTRTLAGNRLQLVVGGGGTALRPFELVGRAADPNYFIRVVYSILAGDKPDGFADGDIPIFELDV